ncbi:MAG: hypothetical protein ACREBG_13950 [Pyrinomonadaceae bacterium]
MNTKTRKLATLVAVVLTLCLFSLEQTSAQSLNSRWVFGPHGNSAQSASAQSPNSTCKKLKGRSVSVFDPATGIASGPVANAGILNGTAEDVINFDSGFVFTPDPNVVACLSDLTITTIHGQLKTSAVVTQSVVTGDGTEWGYINPDTSTGRFAGA